ncbi:hypothetical protein Nepgr_021606 [Nepenthes gracilis]|uniref:tRNA pseudouridine(55) synthase n=1 Tax=Nepenthes gracilis TaxID=150966 RepID=A0AAD3SZ20_NEPGR|nr:hypothetical protein Nepgr_021606 [Nepenthes gracilis]
MVNEAVDCTINNGEQAEYSVPSPSDEIRILNDLMRLLPPVAVKDLLSSGVCFQCILRLFGKYGPRFSNSFHLLSWLATFVDGQTSSGECMENDGLSKNGGSSDPSSSQRLIDEADICGICCGILQCNYIDDNKTLIKHNCTSDFAVSIGEVVKQEGHQAPDGFSLEVSIPPIIRETENAVRLLMKRKYGSDVWFQENLLPEIISVKEALKLSITNHLEKLLGVKCCPSSFRICMTYTCLEGHMKNENNMETTKAYKRSKKGSDNMEEKDGDSVVRIKEHPNLATIEGGLTMGKCSEILQDISLSFKPLLGKVSPCCLAFLCYRMPIYIGGRYLKYSRNVSQTRWIIDDERMGEASVEEIICNTILLMCQGDNYKFHAAGREDIDVRMLGSGRPFLVEIQNARLLPSEAFVKEMEGKINNFENKLVMVKNLKVVDSQGWTLMREGEAEKQKQYAALVWISRSLEDEDLFTISSLKDVKIIQRTPVRVLHRRSPLDREKIIHWMNIEKISGSSQYFVLHLCTQAGTYIKEFVHGDLGRTHPSIGTILGCRAEIHQLDVTDVKMDCFSTN